ncbi:PREDICTED: agamous-like MADS-box protein AGL62 [Theobroma cacao]|uniref:Agamous-like MADS-box protein AGL62 n=1 Tax=Theobroma cacao TaxID=3641 RepID=A0AB32URN2_THECC|nr:PREDICTED: agamous-like MADS-box protein AGL62 [Theobroma cacao]
MVQKNQNQGRQKIAMKKIAKKNNLQVTFSKRRTGLFKKASELCTLCGVDVAIIVFSPAGKVFSFGHPQVESTIDRFLTRNPSLHVSNTHSLVEAHRNANIQELNVQLTRLLEMLEVQKRKGEALEEIREAGRRQCWWQAPTDVLGLNELKQLRIALEELNRNVKKQANKVLVESTNCWQFLTANGIGGGVNNEANEMKAASSVTQMYNLGQGLF